MNEALTEMLRNVSRIVESQNGYNYPAGYTSRARSDKAANCGHRRDKGGGARRQEWVLPGRGTPWRLTEQ